MPGRKKNRNPGVPTEKHDAAAWANIRNKKNHSDITMPSEYHVLNAKLHVDENEK